jgi:hypothetical protein
MTSRRLKIGFGPLRTNFQFIDRSKYFSTVDQLTNTDQSDWIADSTGPVWLVGVHQLIDRISLLRTDTVQELKV